MGTGGGLEQAETYRVELRGYCYRMLGCGFEAEDAVQETMLRAWRNRDGFDSDRGSLRTWLYAIATNVCLDMLRGARRRALAMDLGPAAEPGARLGQPLPEHRWVQPVPDAHVLPAHGDPAELAALRASVRLAFVAALQHLPPRQRAVLILRDVLRWHAEEVSGLLGCTVAAVNSALQRARSTMASRQARPLREPAATEERQLLARYLEAFENYDVAALTALLHEDATMSMPPFTWWLRGRQHIRQVLLAAEADKPCEGARLLPTVANGAPAFAQYRDGEPFALVVVDVVGDLIGATTTYLGARLFELFGLPMSFRAQARISGVPFSTGTSDTTGG
ncbi:RNA polymerase sigma-70 factor, TIGR02960 family [Saccharomonospora marina XMU15]|uniref:RNA polymerase sigma-70 factor, TIGR02960 family n=1 Tax=Saccharomonospora marina XMU15 TaxID=882083 RepID=H5X912_9PSEU|nr:sigma-70 family RNA polymerase sigma factor [Saccharomonospora marina]EHR53615.1 RNA polymerase sigma-70 factor, TIGR02960 family [Saccharomonospora marina XMU15]